MNFQEAGALLAAITAFDHRTVGDTDMKVWRMAMTNAEVALPDALAAVATHFAGSGEWLMPYHVINGIRAARQEALRHAPVPQMPPELHQADERRWIHAYYRAWKAGDTDPHAAADQLLGVHRVEFPAHPERVAAIKQLAATKGI